MKWIKHFIESIGETFNRTLVQGLWLIMLLLLGSIIYFTILLLDQHLYSIVYFIIWIICLLFSSYVIQEFWKKRVLSVSKQTVRLQKKLPENHCDVIYDVLKRKGLFDITKISVDKSNEEIVKIENQISKENFKNYLSKRDENFEPILLTTDQKKAGGLIFDLFAPRLDKPAKEITQNFKYLKKEFVKDINYNSISSKNKRANVQPILNEIEKKLHQNTY